MLNLKIILLLIILSNLFIFESFEIVQNINYYVISMENEDRMNNIIEQTKKINEHNNANISIEIVDAIVGKNLDLQKLRDIGILSSTAELGDDEYKQKNEIGCYLSHMKVYETIKQKNNSGYSVIFEDDFKINNYFLDILDTTISKLQNIDVDFDYLFLGIAGNNGEQVVDNIFNISPDISYQAHGYLINNKNIDKIIEKMKYIETVLDVQIFNKGKQKELNVLRIYPTIVDQNYDQFGSLIR